MRYQLIALFILSFVLGCTNNPLHGAEESGQTMLGRILQTHQALSDGKNSSFAETDILRFDPENQTFTLTGTVETLSDEDREHIQANQYKYFERGGLVKDIIRVGPFLCGVIITNTNDAEIAANILSKLHSKWHIASLFKPISIR